MGTATHAPILGHTSVAFSWTVLLTMGTFPSTAQYELDAAVGSTAVVDNPADQAYEQVGNDDHTYEARPVGEAQRGDHPSGPRAGNEVSSHRYPAQPALSRVRDTT